MTANCYLRPSDTESYCDSDTIPTLRTQTLNRIFDHPADSVGLGRKARASGGINADNLPKATVRARSMLRGLAVTLSN